MMVKAECCPKTEAFCMELQRFLCCSFILEGICLLKPGGV